VRPLRGGSGAHITAGDAEGEEEEEAAARPWQQGDAGILR